MSGDMPELSGDMPERRMEDGQTGGAQPVDVAVERLLDEVVDDALASLRAEGGGSELIRRGIGEMLKEALVSAAKRRSEFAMDAGGNGGGGPLDMSTTAVTAGVTAIKAVKDLGFVEFTAGLINGTFDAVTAATIKQMDEYSKMVADIAKSLREFEADKVSPAQVDAWLTQRYPDPATPGDTVVRAGMVFADVKEGDVVKLTATQVYEKVCESLVRDTQTLGTLATPLKREDLYAEGDIGFGDDSTKIDLVRDKISLLLAKGSQDALIEMARMGMARIVVTNGEILSKLTFKVSATDLDQKVSQHYDQDSRSWGIGGRLSLPLKFLNLSASGGYSSSHFSCNTVNETTFDTTTMSAEIIGQVKIGFKTETFPPAEAPVRTLAAQIP
jgi:hypothetical protein